MNRTSRHLNQVQEQQPISNKGVTTESTTHIRAAKQPALLWSILLIVIIGNLSFAYAMFAFAEKVDSRLSEIQADKFLSDYLRQIEGKLKDVETAVNKNDKQLKEELQRINSVQSSSQKSLAERLKMLSEEISKNEKHLSEGIRQVLQTQSQSSSKNQTSQKVDPIYDFKGEKLQKKLSGEQKLTKNLTSKDAFNVVYQNGLWDATGLYPSGGGSIPQKNTEYLLLVQYLIDSPEINKIVQIGFGDFHLASSYRLRSEKLWVGYDVVPSLLRPNEGNRLFKLMEDIFSFKEEGDLLIEKDVIQHWPMEAVQYFHEQIIPRYKYALISNDYYANRTERPKTNYGQYNPLNVDEKRKHILVLDHTGGQPLKRTYLYPGWPK